MEKNAFFESPNIGRLFMRIAIPGSIGMLASAIYQLIDGIFINEFLGGEAFTAVNLAFPFIIAAYAFSDLIGVGSSVVISIRLGEKRNLEANRIFTSAVLLVLVFNVLVSVSFSLLCPYVFSLMDTTPEISSLAYQYCLPYFLSLPLAGFLFSCDNFLRICGYVKYSMFVNIGSSLLVVLLEFLFLGVGDFPIWGASLASSLSFSVFVIISFIPFFARKTVLRFAKPKISKEEFFFTLRSGLPAFLSNIAGRVTAIVFNSLLLAYGGEGAVSVYGSLMYIDAFVYPLLYGMTDSLQPCLGYNHGAGRHDRVKKLQNYIFLSSFSLCLVVFILLLSFPGGLTYPFLSSADSATLDLARHAAFIFAFLYLVRSFPYAISNLFQATGKPLPSILITFSLSLVFPLLLCLALSPIGLDGIWMNSAISYALGSILAFLLFYFLLLRKRKSPVLGNQDGKTEEEKE